MHFKAHDGLLDRGLKVRPMTLPDIFQDHDTPEKMYAQAGLDADGMVRTALNAQGRGGESVFWPPESWPEPRVPQFGTCGGLSHAGRAGD